jgi:GntR family phosphonate transport system transcriptional regulator
MTPRPALWKSIADTLSAEMAGGHYAPGDRLPTEAQLSARFGVNRHTVRHALATLAEAGLTHSRRGAGVYVTAAPTDYPLGRRVRFHQNLAASGRTASRETLRLETRKADAREAEALALHNGAEVHVFEGLSLADGVPLAMFRASTRLTAKAAHGTLALQLRLAEGAPILRSVAVNVDAAGVPVEYGHTWFAGDRVTLTVTPE